MQKNFSLLLYCNSIVDLLFLICVTNIIAGFMTEKLFVYGTLMDSDIQKDVFGREISGVSDSLYGYRLGTVTFGNETFPAVRKISDSLSGNKNGRNSSGPLDGLNSEGSPADEMADNEVKGIVLTLSGEDFMNADIYEGEYYSRREVTLKSGTVAYLYEIEDVDYV